MAKQREIGKKFWVIVPRFPFIVRLITEKDTGICRYCYFQEGAPQNCINGCSHSSRSDKTAVVYREA